MNEGNKGCEFCTKFDFTAVGYKFDCGKPSIYHIGGSARVEAEHRFKHCPVCGRKLEAHEAMERQMEKKPLLDTIYKMNFYCPNCEEFLVTKGQKQIPNCRYCNQRISWEGENWDENMYKM